jgi:hypothetical protein
VQPEGKVFTLEEASGSSAIDAADNNEIRSLEDLVGLNSPDLVRGVRNPDNLEVR